MVNAETVLAEFERFLDDAESDESPPVPPMALTTPYIVRFMVSAEAWITGWYGNVVDALFGLGTPLVKLVTPPGGSRLRVAVLAEFIDEYDRLTGRTSHREVTDTDLADLSRRVDALAAAGAAQ